MSEEAFIYEAIRTPRGKQRNGSLNEVKPLNLVVGLVDELRRRFPDLDESLISDMILGVVSPVGDQGGDIARTAVLAAGLPETTGGVQLNRFCASGLEAVNIASQKVRSGWDDLVLAGGVESMSRVPMGSDGGAWATDPETNYRIGFVPQGIGADLIATIEGFSREDVDRYAHERLGGDDTFFDFADVPNLYFLLNRDCPVRQIAVPFFEADGAQRDVVARIARNPHVRAALVRANPTVGIDGVPNSVRAPIVWRYLQANFAPDVPVGDIVIWRRVRW